MATRKDQPAGGRAGADPVRTKIRQVRRVLRDEGIANLGARALGPLARRINDRNASLGVRAADVLAADLAAPPPDWKAPPYDGGALTVNWVTTPSSGGSGGHTTMFRIIEHLVAQGHHCRIYLYDISGGKASDHEAAMRNGYPAAGCEIHDALDGMADAHAVFATAWGTAYVAFNDPCAGRRFYFVQDFEPSFFPQSARSTLAENTYRMGFHAVTAGRWLAEKLHREYAMAADSFDFGCDLGRYNVQPNAVRNGIAFYARRDAPRRAYELGILALELFAAARPDLQIHLYGEPVGKLPFPFVDHGLVKVEQLNEIYNSCFAGLNLSMTNVSLVPYEMLAAGCVPVVNEAEHNRVVLDNPYVHYAPPTPHGLAGALLEVVNRPDFADAIPAMAASVSTASWADAGAKVEAVLRRELSR